METQPHEEIEETNSPLKYILAVLLLLLLILMIIPYYGVRTDPRPENIPSLQEVLYQAPNSTYTKLQTINDIKDVKITPLIKHAVAKISTSCNEVSNICYAKAIFYFVQNNIRYVPDPEIQYVESPDETLTSGAADCEGLAILTTQLLKAVNIRSRIVLTNDHAFVQIYLPEALNSYKTEEDWVSADPTSNLKIGEVNPRYLKNIETYIYI